MSKITIETTDDSKIIKFVADHILTESSFEYHSIEDAKNSPLSQHLFRLPFVKKVYITANFIALERFDMVEWKEVQDDLKGILEGYLTQNKPIFSESKNTTIEVFAESTPNPNTQKFVTNKFLTSQSIEITNITDAKDVPLAFELFEYPFVKEVFISQNYISITKDNSLEWFEVNNAIRDFLKEYLQGDKNVISNDFEPKLAQQIDSNSDKYTHTNDETSKQIVSLLNEYIKPAVAIDGGNIQFQSYDENTKTVNVVLQGACNGCPSSTITLKNGIEATLKQFLGDKIACVNAVN
ncbi:MAG: NifU family protein [Bacteroidota bacterium]